MLKSFCQLCPKAPVPAGSLPGASGLEAAKCSGFKTLEASISQRVHSLDGERANAVKGFPLTPQTVLLASVRNSVFCRGSRHGRLKKTDDARLKPNQHFIAAAKCSGFKTLEASISQRVKSLDGKRPNAVKGFPLTPQTLQFGVLGGSRHGRLKKPQRPNLWLVPSGRPISAHP
jgi:hypothetical protein